MFFCRILCLHASVLSGDAGRLAMVSQVSRTVFLRRTELYRNVSLRRPTRQDGQRQLRLGPQFTGISWSVRLAVVSQVLRTVFLRRTELCRNVSCRGPTREDNKRQLHLGAQFTGISFSAVRLALVPQVLRTVFLKRTELYRKLSCRGPTREDNKRQLHANAYSGVIGLVVFL